MITNVDSSDQTVKHSTCYACGQILYSYSMLVCPECLDDECEKFANLVDDVTSPSKEIKKKKK
jgi:hypothetical protein